MIDKRKATLHDGSVINIEVHGNGPAVLLPVNPIPLEGVKADEMRQWGVDPALGQNLMDGLSDTFKVIAFDYEGHVIANPKPDTLTPDNIARDFLAVADAAGAEKFAYYGYSWLALSGLQLALRTDRLSALIMGGYPPLDGPYDAMLKVTMATYEMAVEQHNNPKTIVEPKPPKEGQEIDWDAADVVMSEAQTRQFATLYQALRGFDDRAAQAQIQCPRLCFVGSADEMDYGERWGNTHVSIAAPLLNKRAEIEAFGWDVRVLDGMDHMQAMQVANVLPIIRPWLIEKLIG